MSRDGQFLVAYGPLESNPVEEVHFFTTHIEIKLRDGRVIIWEASNPVRLECEVCRDCKQLSHFMSDGYSIYECREEDPVTTVSKFVREIEDPDRTGCAKFKRRNHGKKKSNKI